MRKLPKACFINRYGDYATVVTIKEEVPGEPMVFHYSTFVSLSNKEIDMFKYEIDPIKARGLYGKRLTKFACKNNFKVLLDYNKGGCYLDSEDELLRFYLTVGAQ